MAPKYFYADVDSWMGSLIQEQLEALGKDDQKDFIKSVYNGELDLKDWCYNELWDHNMVSDEMLLTAILNSCDWDALKVLVIDFKVDDDSDSEDEEDGDDSSDEDPSPRGKEPYVRRREDDPSSSDSESDSDEFWVDDRDAPNVMPYKKCALCGDRKSCGNYTEDNDWNCEDCYSEDEDKDE